MFICVNLPQLVLFVWILRFSNDPIYCSTARIKSSHLINTTLAKDGNSFRDIWVKRSPVPLHNLVPCCEVTRLFPLVIVLEIFMDPVIHWSPGLSWADTFGMKPATKEIYLHTDLLCEFRSRRRGLGAEPQQGCEAAEQGKDEEKQTCFPFCIFWFSWVQLAADTTLSKCQIQRQKSWSEPWTRALLFLLNGYWAH